MALLSCIPEHTIDSAHSLFVSKHDHVQIHYSVRAAPSFLVLRHFDYNLADVLLAELVLVRLAEVLEVEYLVDDRLEFHSRDETVHILESANVNASALANQTATGGEVLTVHASQ